VSAASKPKGLGTAAKPWELKTPPGTSDFQVYRDDAADPPALALFLSLPTTQRRAVILKDVLDHSLEETAETTGTTVMAVKAALVRGRRRLLELHSEQTETNLTKLADLDRYARLFNARDWDGVRALVSEDCRLDLVSKSQRRGKQVGMYFGRYEKEDVVLRVVRLEGALAYAAYTSGAEKPACFILLEFEAGRVTSIRDFRYVPYIAAEAELEIVGKASERDVSDMPP
jgi:RNA polymerase sigma-70 factor (ECF subfamily)